MIVGAHGTIIHTWSMPLLSSGIWVARQPAMVRVNGSPMVKNVSMSSVRTLVCTMHITCETASIDLMKHDRSSQVLLEAFPTRIPTESLLGSLAISNAARVNMHHMVLLLSTTYVLANTSGVVSLIPWNLPVYLPKNTIRFCFCPGCVALLFVIRVAFAAADQMEAACWDTEK